MVFWFILHVSFTVIVKLVIGIQTHEFLWQILVIWIKIYSIGCSEWERWKVLLESTSALRESFREKLKNATNYICNLIGKVKEIRYYSISFQYITQDPTKYYLFPKIFNKKCQNDQSSLKHEYKGWEYL